MTRSGKSKKLILLAIISILILLVPTSQALIYKSDTDQGRYTEVRVTAIYDTSENKAFSIHRITVYSVPGDDIIEGVASLECEGNTLIKIYYFAGPAQVTKNHVCPSQTAYATARTYTLIVADGVIDANAVVEVP